MWVQILLLLAAQGTLTAQAATLVATISSGGVKGTVTFTQANAGEAVTVAYDLSGPNVGEASTWQFHTFRLNYDVMDRCSESNLGPRILTSVSGTAQATGTTSVSGFDLSGVNSIEGRSLVLLKSDGSALACATAENTADYVTASATFFGNGGILGRVYFRQLASLASALTRLTADLYWDGSKSAEQSVEWRIVDNEDCSNIGSAYNPSGVTGSCTNANTANCAVGDLSGKLGNVNIGVTMGTSRMTLADLNLPLSATNSVIGKTLKLFATGQSTPLACAVIHEFMSRTGVATFDNDGVTGTISVTQLSPLDPAVTRVDLQNLRSLAGGYHVHKWPVSQRVTKDQALCSGDSVSGHFNPFNVVYDATSPGAAVSTEDMYEVGDLSRKYGMLNDQNALAQNYSDYNLPLFGANSVLGRSIVIHRNLPGNPRWICANLQDTAALTSALATFTSPVIGYVLLQQHAGYAGAETSVYVELDYADGTTTTTTGHDWAVHANAADDSVTSSDVSGRCGSTGGVTNPTGVSDTGYAAQCMSSDPLRCKLGDLKGKHGTLSVRGSNAAPARAFFTDVHLPLQGPNSVLGKALVLLAADGGSQTLACSNVLTVWPLKAQANVWGDSTDHGSLTLTQPVGVVHNPTTIQLDLKQLATSGATSYRVENKPVSMSSSERCNNLGGVYNPFEVSTPGITKDSIAVGDLSAKFGDLSGPSVYRTDIDPSLDLWGPRGVMGRAVTLTSAGSNVNCADLETKVTPVHSGMLFKAKAVFTGDYTGEITMTQLAYPGGALMPTTVILNLRKANGSQTERHNWHTHEKMVHGDASASTGRCSSTGGHYNPFKVNMESSYSECSLSNPLRCELGDQANKLGTYDMGSGPMVATDVYLPLYGPFGVVGRSIVVHAADRGAPRVACADIMPADMTNSYLMAVATPLAFSMSDMQTTISSTINTAPYNLALQMVTENLGVDKCSEVRIYFIGMDAVRHRQDFNRVISGNSKVLGAYKPVTCNAGKNSVLSEKRQVYRALEWCLHQQNLKFIKRRPLRRFFWSWCSFFRDAVFPDGPPRP